MNRIVKYLTRIGKKIFFNYDRPYYSAKLYRFCRKYEGFYNGESLPDQGKNGEHRILKILALNARTIIDVGANTGLFTKLSRMSAPAHCMIHAFEPDAASFKKLKQLVQTHNFTNIICTESAVGEVVEKKTFQIKARSVLNSFYTHPRTETTASVIIPVTTLDAYCAEHAITHIDFLKIDTEGHDLFVLRGAKGLLEEKRIDCIQFELAQESVYAKVFLKDFTDLLSSYGYEVFKLRSQDLMPFTYDPSHERFTYMNYVALSPELAPTLRHKLIQAEK
jgi:FkbM family methyltransferase